MKRTGHSKGLGILDRRGIRYAIAITPRNLLARALARIELNQVTKPKVDAAIASMLARLGGRDAVYDPLPGPLSVPAEERLLSLVPRVPPPTGERLATHLREAPLHGQARIQPLRLSADWGVPEDRLLDGMLTAVREGMLELRWDLLCPNCRGPKHSASSLGELGGAVHCPSCNIAYDGSFPDSIVVCFRPDTSLRALGAAAPAWRAQRGVSGPDRRLALALPGPRGCPPAEPLHRHPAGDQPGPGDRGPHGDTHPADGRHDRGRDVRPGGRRRRPHGDPGRPSRHARSARRRGPADLS